MAFLKTSWPQRLFLSTCSDSHIGCSLIFVVPSPFNLHFIFTYFPLFSFLVLTTFRLISSYFFRTGPPHENTPLISQYQASLDAKYHEQQNQRLIFICIFCRTKIHKTRDFSKLMRNVPCVRVYYIFFFIFFNLSSVFIFTIISIRYANLVRLKFSVCLFLIEQNFFNRQYKIEHFSQFFENPQGRERPPSAIIQIKQPSKKWSKVV